MDRTLRRETALSISSTSEKWRFQRFQSHLSSHELVSGPSTAAQLRRQIRDGFLRFRVVIGEAKECDWLTDTQKFARLLVARSGFGDLGAKRMRNWGTGILCPITHGWVVAIFGGYGVCASPESLTELRGVAWFDRSRVTTCVDRDRIVTWFTRTFANFTLLYIKKLIK